MILSLSLSSLRAWIRLRACVTDSKSRGRRRRSVHEGPYPVEGIGRILTSGHMSEMVHFLQLKEADIAQDQFGIEAADGAVSADRQLPCRWVLALAPASLARHGLGRVDLESRNLTHRGQICGGVEITTSNHLAVVLLETFKVHAGLETMTILRCRSRDRREGGKGPWSVPSSTKKGGSHHATTKVQRTIH